jgi:hypothetical protein
MAGASRVRKNVENFFARHRKMLRRLEENEVFS